MSAPAAAPPPAHRQGSRDTLCAVRAARPALLCAVAVCAAACSGTPLHSVPKPTPVANPQVSPSVQPVTSGPAAPAEPPVVVLDAGHNGGNASHPADIRRPVPDGRGGTKECNTTGTSTDAGYPEHAFTFDVTARAAQELTAAGVRVVLVRTDDTGVGPCVDVRGRAAEANDAALMVSIHADGAPPHDSGFHVALPDPPLNPAQAAPSRALGDALRDAMRAGGFPDSDYLGQQGISLRTDLAGLNLATRPVALVECANMRNPAEAAVVSSEDGRGRYAHAIATGILAYLPHP
jgi:N-acetylmuramoyl-L-alanine amidase